MYTLLTGACGGLGGAFARLLARRGQALFLTGRSEERLASLADALHAEFPGLPVLHCACDLADSAQRAALFAFADGQGVRFSRLVYVAGIDTQKAFEAYSEEKLVMQTRVNLEGAVSLAHGVLMRRSEQTVCELLAVGSMSASAPMPYFALYSAIQNCSSAFLVALYRAK